MFENFLCLLLEQGAGMISTISAHGASSPHHTDLPWILACSGHRCSSPPVLAPGGVAADSGSCRSELSDCVLVGQDIDIDVDGAVHAVVEPSQGSKRGALRGSVIDEFDVHLMCHRDES
ncbi:MAG TPA: hypothetical protein VHH34_11945, partial [Pseudonocardiaceae bacterium]|nr:hypothetical protein [Pseudonocardiaceae bacterium]